MSLGQPQPFALRADPNAAPRVEQFRADLNVRLTCPDCQDENVQLVEEFGSGDLVCGGCGLVLGDRIVDTRSEWRSFADSEGDDPSRVGGPQDPLLDAAEQFSTIISFKDGNTGAAKALQMAASRVSKDQGGGRDLQAAFRDIGTMCDVISLPRSIVDTSKQLFKRVDEEKLLKGKSQDAIIAACIFIACRQGRVARTFKEIVALTNVPKKDIGQCFKVLERAFETTAPGQAPPSSATSADSLITRYCNHLGLPVPVQRASVYVGTRAGEEGILAGRSPITIAAACILFATMLWGVAKPTKDIAMVAGVQESTIRTAFKILTQDKEKLVNQQWFDASRLEGTRADWANLGL
ncbi:transcription initiation factor IIB [Leucosporidium creatinivorum]|uniref:Transcription initiation factor IIB n=1 Tax=Leucosporidium creatinivorum TaxID=106004 RepID=A0A1Y2F2A0_9BASI|nr:transcription initiation factor IIB [Leucosporidium creatinivorum]